MDDQINNPYYNPPEDENEYQEHLKVSQFMFDLARGLTCKVPPGVTRWVIKPLEADINAAVLYIVQHNERYAKEKLSYIQMNTFQKLLGVAVRAFAYEAAEYGRTVLTYDDVQKWIEKRSTEAYYEKLYEKGMVDLMIGPDPDAPLEVVISESGIDEYADLYTKESQKLSYLTNALDKLVGGKENSKRLVREQTGEVGGVKFPKNWIDILFGDGDDENLDNIPTDIS